MSMSSKEVMHAAVGFKTPDRLPVNMAALGWADCHQIGLGHRSGRVSGGPGLDEWGCRWERSAVENMGYVKGHPITDLRDIPTHPFPDPRDSERLDRIHAQLRAPELEGKYILLGQFMILFERMHSLLGMAEVLEGLYLHREEMESLANRIVDYNVRTIEFLGKNLRGKVDSYSGSDDWGTQLASFISPVLWEDFFLPKYARIFGAANAQGWNVRLHSCGRINDLIALMRAAGVNQLNLQQPRVNGIEELGRRFAGQICIESLCDIQQTLPKGVPSEIADEADLILEHLATPEGGFVLSDYGDSGAIGADPTGKRTMLAAFLDRDPYSDASGVSHPARAALKSIGTSKR